MKPAQYTIAILPALIAVGHAALAADGTAADSTELPTVEVMDKAPTAEGGARDGYRHTDADLGPLGKRKLADTPFSVNAVSSELLRNFGAETYSEAVKYLPSAYVEGHFGLEIGPPVIRGLLGDDSAGSVRIDGLNIRADIPVPVELYEKLELLNGPVSALYGPAPAAGVVNATLKRPTSEPLREVGLGYSSRGNLQGRADISDRLGDDGAFGYRFNVLSADGESYTAGSNLRRRLIGAALDYRLSPGTQIEALASHYDYDFRGLPGKFVYSNATGLPAAPDPAKSGYGQTYGGVNSSIDLLEARLTHDLGTGWKLDGAVQRQVMTRIFNDTVTNTFTDDKGNYSTGISQNGSRSEVLSNRIYLNGSAKTGSLTHDLTLGTVGYRLDNYSLISPIALAAKTVNGYKIAGWIGNASLDAPLDYANPYGAYDSLGPTYHASQTKVQSVTLGDTLGFNEHWSAVLVGNDSWIKSQSWNANGSPKAGTRYEENGSWSYSGSLLYKPLPTGTVYATYASSVEPGNISPSDGSTKNPGEILAPYRSEETEVGIKASLQGMDYTAALFRIRRPFAFTDSDGYYKTAGEQENRGMELTARGKATEHLAVFASYTWLDPRMTAVLNKSVQGNVVVGVPRQQANLLADYRLPGQAGVYLEGNLHYLGSRYANLENTLQAAAVTTLDLGARYETRWGSHKLNARLMVTNVTDRHYWNTLYASWSGATTTNSSGSAFLGEPRTVKLSATMNF